jgi:hypothetical protein
MPLYLTHNEGDEMGKPATSMYNILSPTGQPSDAAWPCLFRHSGRVCGSFSPYLRIRDRRLQLTSSTNSLKMSFQFIKRCKPSTSTAPPFRTQTAQKYRFSGRALTVQEDFAELTPLFHEQCSNNVAEAVVNRMLHLVGRIDRFESPTPEPKHESLWPAHHV